MPRSASRSACAETDERAAQPDSSALAADPIESARAVGLHHVTDAMPGIRRARAGSGFTYRDPEGKTVRDRATLERIRSLAIPPAWTDVWICPSPSGHLQATGRDAKGRKQYRYHPRWREIRDSTKYDRMIAFGEALPRIRERIEQDLARRGLPGEKVLATVVDLLQTTFIRVGNPEYARDNHSFGLTTMRDRHVQINGPELEFAFVGKGGKKHHVTLRDRRLARIVKRCRDIPGYELFQYLDEHSARHSITSTEVNDYLREISGQEFTAKDFRTWAGTVLAAAELRQQDAAESKHEREHNVVDVVKSVAAQLGNTPAVCRRCYVHPAVIEAYLSQGFPRIETAVETEPSHQTGLQPEEEFVMTLLRQSSDVRQAA